MEHDWNAYAREAERFVTVQQALDAGAAPQVVRVVSDRIMEAEYLAMAGTLVSCHYCGSKRDEIIAAGFEAGIAHPWCCEPLLKGVA